jgi:thymidylate synthase (FAD)
MLLRVYDEVNKVFTESHVNDVVYSGKQDIFEIEMEGGSKLRCSKHHLILTSEGWQRLEDAIGLSLSASGVATLNKDCFIVTNGTTSVWQSREWMEKQREAGLSVQQIADKAGCSYHCVRKWLRVHGLQFDQKEYWFGGGNSVPWNKGKRGYSQPPRTPEHLEKLRAKVQRGPDSNFWRGGVTSERASIGAWTTAQAPRVHAKYDYVCQICGKRGGELHAHHLKPVVEYPELAYDFENLISVCATCHASIHRRTELARSHDGTPLAAKLKKVLKVTYLGPQDTYDISVEGPHHNFVANGVVVHNSFNAQSGRYTAFEEEDFYAPQVWRKQSPSNKQASLGQLTLEEGQPFTAELLEHYKRGYALYKRALDAGIAREQARVFLPGFSVYYTWVCKVDAHNLIHFLSLRMASDAQYEIRVYAKAIYKHFFKPALPWTAEACEKFVFDPTVELD